MLPVYADVAFVPIVGFTMLLSPAGFNILLAAFVIAPCLRAVPIFGLPIFLSRIVSPGYWNDDGIYNLSLASTEACCINPGVITESVV